MIQELQSSSLITYQNYFFITGLTCINTTSNYIISYTKRQKKKKNMQPEESLLTTLAMSTLANSQKLFHSSHNNKAYSLPEPLILFCFNLINHMIFIAGQIWPEGKLRFSTLQQIINLIHLHLKLLCNSLFSLHTNCLGICFLVCY